VDEHRITTADKVSVIPLGFDLSRFQTDQVNKARPLPQGLWRGGR
jgi:hypothetical protein